MRLEPETIGTVLFTRVFQFHKGAIRTPRLLARSYLREYFNSIKVRLELDVPERDNLGNLTFQFHKGAIRTQALSINVSSF